MRQRNQVENVIRAAHSKLPADHFFEVVAADKLRNGQSTNWNNQTRLQNRDLLVHPRSAISNFVRGRNAIGPAARGFSGETSANGGEINS